MNAIPGSKGIQINVANKLKVNRASISRFMDKNPECAERLKEEAEIVLDQIENAAYEIADLPDDPKLLPAKVRMINKILSSKGAKRGWADTTNQNQNISGDSIKLEIIDKTEDVRKDTTND